MTRTTHPARLLPGANHPATTRVGGPPEDRRYARNPDLPYSQPVIHESAIIQSHVTIDGGVSLGDDDIPTMIQRDVLIMAHCHIGHNALVCAGAELAPHVVLGGYASVHQGAKLGMGAIVLPYRVIGEDAVVGAGSVVTKNVPPRQVWAGNPAAPVRPSATKNPTPYTERDTKIAGYDDEGVPLNARGDDLRPVLARRLDTPADS